jgi:hypothetical protein
MFGIGVLALNLVGMNLSDLSDLSERNGQKLIVWVRMRQIKQGKAKPSLELALTRNKEQGTRTLFRERLV